MPRFLTKTMLFFLTLCTAFNSYTTCTALRFHQSQATLNAITGIVQQRKKGAYLRFGDGDVNLALGLADMLQRPNTLLQQEMQEALSLNGTTVLKALPLHCTEFDGLEDGMFPGNHASNYQLSSDLLNKVNPLWGAPINDVYSPVALHFCATNHQATCIKFLRFLKQHTCILVGNQHIPLAIRTLLFGPNCNFIPTPAQNSYTQIDRIEHDCLQAVKAQEGNYTIIITSMGCSGRVLQKRLWHKLDNVFLFDFGSLMDALCGWNTRAWIELSNFDANHFITMLARKTYIVSTAALIDQDYASRKEEYLRSLDILSSYGYTPYIVESCNQTNRSFLDDYNSRVLYTHTNDSSLRNKGVNEAASLAAACKTLPFNDTDLIIKLTGRYYFNSDSFFKIIKDNPHIEAFVKADEHGQIFTGCFALAYHHFKKVYATLNLEHMERDMINIEYAIAQYITQHVPADKIMYLNTLDVTAPIFGTGERMLTHW